MNTEKRIEVLLQIQDKYRCYNVQEDLLEIAELIGSKAFILKQYCELWLISYEKQVEKYEEDYVDWVYNSNRYSKNRPIAPALTIEDLKNRNTHPKRSFEFTEEELLALNPSYATQKELEGFK